LHRNPVLLLPDGSWFDSTFDTVCPTDNTCEAEPAFRGNWISALWV